MTDLAALEAQKKTITDEIAALEGDAGRPLPFRTKPSNNSARLGVLAKQLATVNMKLKLAAKKAANPTKAATPA